MASAPSSLEFASKALEDPIRAELFGIERLEQHAESRFDPEALRRFVRAYQRVQPLTVGELWAVPITLRVVLVENLRRLTESIVRARAARHEADVLADELLGISGRPLETAAWALQQFEDAQLST